jgi:hypothetical protein
VHLKIELVIDRPHADVWAMVRDLPRFSCIDPFHRRLILLQPEIKDGTEFAIEHGAFGFSFLRFGRLLRWQEGRGYALSDLSARGPRHGFPHVFCVEVVPVGSEPLDRTLLRVEVHGKWTARWLPLWVRKMWLCAVCTVHAHMLRSAFVEKQRE